MPIREEVLSEYFRLDDELKRISERMKELRERKKVLEKEVIPVLESEGTIGVAYKGDQILIRTRNCTRRKAKDERYESTIQLLKELKVKDVDDVYKKLDEVGKRESTQIKYLKRS